MVFLIAVRDMGKLYPKAQYKFGILAANTLIKTQTKDIKNTSGQGSSNMPLLPWMSNGINKSHLFAQWYETELKLRFS